jgi:hypothetical protein
MKVQASGPIMLVLWHLCRATLKPNGTPQPTKTTSELFEILVFVWVWRFCGCHMFAWEGGSVCWLQCFLGSVWVWHMSFSAHLVHGAMLEWVSCACGGMYRLLYSPQVAEQHEASVSN